MGDDLGEAVTAVSFHWFDNEAALTEIARVLRPRGTLVVTWNVGNGPPVPSIAAVEELLAPIWPAGFGFPLDMMTGDWAPDAWDLPFVEHAFDQIREARLPNPQTVDQDGLIAFFGSMGWVANLTDEEPSHLLRRWRHSSPPPSMCFPGRHGTPSSRLNNLPGHHT